MQNNDISNDKIKIALIRMANKKSEDHSRQNPNEFLDLTSVEIKSWLDEIYGEGGFVFRLNQDFSPSYSVTVQTRIEHVILDYIEIGDFSTIAKFLFFFGIRNYRWPHIDVNTKDPTFVFHFPFGCFHDPKVIVWSEFNTCHIAIRWCEGKLFDTGIMDKILYVIDDDTFEVVLKQLPRIKFSRTETCSIIKLANQNNFEIGLLEKVTGHGNQKCQKRAARLISVVSQMIPYSDPSQSHMDSIIFPCFMPDHYQHAFIPSVPPPIWTRERHRELCLGTNSDVGFSEIAMTILLMQKFRWTNFPLAKDLLPMVLGFAFDAHIDHLKFNMSLRTMLFRLWRNEIADGGGKLHDLGLKYGIYIHNPPEKCNTLDLMSDIYDLTQGLTISDYWKRKYRKCFASVLVRLRNTNTRDLNAHLVEFHRGVYPSLIKVFELVIDYCVNRGISFVAVFNNEYVFSDGNIAAIKDMLSSSMRDD